MAFRVSSSLAAFSACSRLLLFILPLWFCLLARVDALAVNRTDEVKTLLGFRDANTVDYSSQHRYKGDWLSWKKTDETPCAWFGVTCTANHTVEELDFAGWGLTLVTLEALHNLTDLRHLDLSSNYLGVIFPEVIGNFTGLTYLDLSQTGISLEDITGISTCWNLRFLALQQNYLQYLPSGMRDLVNLQYLNLSYNFLGSLFPTEALGGLSVN
ncbi:unnamed protein product [Calypogeia fissa]